MTTIQRSLVRSPRGLESSAEAKPRKRTRKAAPEADGETCQAVDIPQIRSAGKNDRLILSRRRQLVDAAVKIFRKHGFHGATVRSIGKAANLTQGTIYNYVRSKEDILYLVCDRIVTDYLDRIGNAYAERTDPAERLRAAVWATVQAMLDHRTEIIVLYRETHHLSPRWQDIIHARLNEPIKLFENLILDVKAMGLASEFNIRFIANIMTYLPTIFAQRSWGLPKDIDDEEMVLELVQFLLRGIGFKSLDTLSAAVSASPRTPAAKSRIGSPRRGGSTR